MWVPRTNSGFQAPMTSSCEPSHLPPFSHSFFLRFILFLIVFWIQKRVGLSGLSTEHDIISYSKTRCKPSYQGWMRQLRRRKRIQEQPKESETFPVPLLGVPRKHQAAQHNVYVEDLAQPHAGPVIATLVSVGPMSPAWLILWAMFSRCPQLLWLL